MMIRSMIDKWIQTKQNVSICCHFGREQYAYFQGTIMELGADNDTIRLVCPHQHPQGTMIPMAAIHTIVASNG